jgi:hypothetical protein
MPSLPANVLDRRSALPRSLTLRALPFTSESLPSSVYQAAAFLILALLTTTRSGYLPLILYLGMTGPTTTPH